MFLDRLTSLLATLFVASFLIFAMLNILPGDPALVMLGVNAREDTLEALRNELGLNLPWYSRYFSWLGEVLRGDFGQSYTYDTPVTGLILERAQVSLPLAAISMLITVIIAIPAGIAAAIWQGTAGDNVVTGATQIGIAIPNFWFALLLILFFAVYLKILPAGGFAGWDDGWWQGLKSLILPAISLALPQAAILTRLMRSALLDQLHEDYLRTARAKGLKKQEAILHHAVPNALIPVFTIMGLQFSFLIAGTVIIENVFYLPGLGRLVFQAIAQRDLIVLQGLILILVALVIVVNFLADAACAWIDPRWRAQ